MVKERVWQQGKSKDAKVVALMTKVSDLESKLQQKTPSLSSNSNPTSKVHIADWRKTKDSDSKIVDGKHGIGVRTINARETMMVSMLHILLWTRSTNGANVRRIGKILSHRCLLPQVHLSLLCQKV